jgi:S-adenosylmethionine:tRNA ribosyltransferase-isomerase
MRVDLFDFDLPEDLIALRPARPRDAARLLIAPDSGAFVDAVVTDAARLFRAGDVLVCNDTRVIPAALTAERPARDGAGAGVRVTLNLIERLAPDRWRALARPGKRIKAGDALLFEEGLSASVEDKLEASASLRFSCSGAALDAAIAAIGVAPLPPYIASRRPADEADRADYQTMFAARDGAVAAPTAGLHFTKELLARLEAVGVELVASTLHVGAGTFLPVKAMDTSAHAMHAEWRELSDDAADAVNRARAGGRRVIAIGTTALRTLESAADETGRVRAVSGPTDIFITPGYRFRVVDGLWTNFHLPRSTLFMLVAAFISLERAHALYAHAIAQKYRFYSYGDASLLWRSDTPQ